MTNGLSPLMQAVVGGEKKIIPGQQIIKDGDNFYYDTGGDDQIYLEDPDGIIAGNTKDGEVEDVDFLFEETEDGTYKIIGVKGESKNVDPDAPGTPGTPGYEPPVQPGGPMGGVGETPMEMASPYKNYRNPQDYEVFNWGNKPTPFEKRKKY